MTTYRRVHRYTGCVTPAIRQKRTPTARLAICTTGTSITCFGATSGGRLDDAVVGQADTCVPCAGPVATVRDGSRRAASAGRSRRSEHPDAKVSVAETLIGRACEQPGFAVSGSCANFVIGVTQGEGVRVCGAGR